MKKKKIMIIVIIILVVLFGIVAIGIYAIKDYVAKTPKITMKWIGEVEAGKTLTLQDLVDVECDGDYHLDIAINTNIDDAKVSDDKQSLYVGSQSGYIKVVVSGSGRVAEHTSAEGVVYVGFGEEDRENFIKRANKVAEITEKYIEEEYIPEHEEFEDMKLVRAIYSCQITPDFPQISNTLELKMDLEYQKTDGSYVYLFANFTVESGEEKINVREQDSFLTSIQMFDEANETGEWWMNIGDGIILQKSSDNMSGVPVEAYHMNYMYLIDYENK